MMEVIPKILYTTIAILVAYLIVYRLSSKKKSNFNIQFFKYLIGLIVVAIVFELGINILNSKPDIVTQAIEQLKSNPEIKRTIGDYHGFGYNKNDVNKIQKLPTELNFTLNGNISEIQVTALIDSSNNVFEVVRFEISSILKK